MGGPAAAAQQQQQQQKAIAMDAPHLLGKGVKPAKYNVSARASESS
jgi:hypothetical protein